MTAGANPVIPFVDLKAQYQTLKSEIRPAVTKVMEDGNFVLGKQCKDFEEAFAKYLGANHALGVANGTDALNLALRALGIGPGDEVITAANSFVASAQAIWQSGARPVLVDCEADSYNMDPNLIERAITKKTKALMPVHLYGQSADMDRIMAIAKGHGLKVVEDACQAHGAYFRGRRVGTFGDVSCFSFYPGKNLGAYGDGGMIVCQDRAVAEKVELLRSHGSLKKYEHVEKGFNSRLDTMQAAVLQVKLPHLDAWNKRRFEHAKSYTDQLAGVAGVTTPKLTHPRDAVGGIGHVFHLYVVRVTQRADLMRVLTEANVQCGIHYPIPIHMQAGYQDLGYRRGDFPNAEAYAEQILSLPMFAELSAAQIGRTCDVVARFHRAKGRTVA